MGRFEDLSSDAHSWSARAALEFLCAVLQQDLFQTHQNRYFDHFMDKEKKARPASAAYKLFPQDLPADGMNYSEVQQEIENRSYKPQHDNPWSPAKLQIEYDENNKPIDRQFEI